MSDFKKSDWIEVPIDLIDLQLKDLGIDQEGQKAFAVIRKSAIASFRLNVNNNGEIEGSVIYTMDGEQYWCHLEYDKLKALINE